MYRQITSLREYLIVAQDRPYAEHHVRDRQDGKLWTMREYTDLDNAVTLESIHVLLSLSDIYAKISF
jgi:Uma2 family endonuclease